MVPQVEKYAPLIRSVNGARFLDLVGGSLPIQRLVSQSAVSKVLGVNMHVPIVHQLLFLDTAAG